MLCPACQHENPAGHRFCTRCGESLTPQCDACGSRGVPEDLFCSHCGEPLPAEPPTASLPEDSESRGFTAELRQISFLFADLVDSTEYASALDPEDWREVVRRYHSVCASETDRFDGHVAQYMGDGVLIYFGYPTGSERDAEAAVRAALGIVAGVSTLSHHLEAEGHPQLLVRVGVHTGTVVTDPGSANRKPPAVGDTVNLASRFERLAESNTVVISSATHDLVHEHFLLDDLGARTVKGVSDPVRAWKVIGERPTSRRSALESLNGSPPMVGREKELASLLESWKDARGGKGRVVTLTGEAGLGKSRLVTEFRSRLSRESHDWLAGSCSPFRRNSALSPLIDLLREAVGWGDGQTPAERAQKLAEQLTRVSGDAMPLLGGLLGLAPRDDDPTLALPPEKRRIATLTALSAWLRDRASEKPIVVVIEDLHWADPTTLEFLEQTADWAARVPMLMILTHRPTSDSSWRPGEYGSTLELHHFSNEESTRLVEEWTRDVRLPRRRLEQLVAHGDGIPLFVAELARMEAASSAGPGRGTGADDVPATLKDLLEARLDGLGAAKELAQFGSIIGRKFSFGLLRNLSGLPSDRLQRDLQQLIDADLLERDGPPERATYVFKSWLMHEVAHGSILKRQRRDLHAKVAAELEANSPDVVAASPEQLAHHYQIARSPEAALPYWDSAIGRALGAFANEEAAAHAEMAISSLHELEGGRERDEREARLLLTRAGALAASRGFSDRAIEEPLLRAVQLSRDTDGWAGQATGLTLLCAHNMQLGEHEKTRELGEELVRLSEDHSDRRTRLTARFILSAAQLWCGDYPDSLARSAEAIALYEPEDFRNIGTGGADVGITARGIHGLALWASGEPDRALEEAEIGIEAGRNHFGKPHYFSLCWALSFKMRIQIHRREPLAARATASELIEVSREHRFDRLLAWGTSFHACALIDTGETGSGIAALERSLADYDDVEAGFWRSTCHCWLAQGYGAVGRHEEALEILYASQTHAGAKGEFFYAPELHRIEGDILLARDPGSFVAAEAAYQKALEISRRAGGRGWELRVLVSLARLRCGQERAGEGRALLRPVYEAFDQGADLPDLREARELLRDTTR